jgi:hypothetical protein
MNKERNNDRLLGVLSRLGMDITEYPNGISWSHKISLFRKKMDLLATKPSYSRLLKSLYASNDLDEFNSYVLEVLFLTILNQGDIHLNTKSNKWIMAILL